jgi:hypothetical protein
MKRVPPPTLSGDLLHGIGGLDQPTLGSKEAFAPEPVDGAGAEEMPELAREMGFAKTSKAGEFGHAQGKVRMQSHPIHGAAHARREGGFVGRKGVPAGKQDGELGRDVRVDGGRGR